MYSQASVMPHSPPVHHRKRSAAYLACAVFLILADFLFITKIAAATPPYTPYANSVASQSGLNVDNGQNAVGAPDGQNAALAGVNSTLTLDMGQGEEGTGPLKVYFGTIQANAALNVAFLDTNQVVISQQSQQLFFNTSASTATFGYDWHDSGKAYRFVRLSSTAGGGENIDAIEALGFIGSTPTQDTDGDGIPDRQDAQPLVFNSGASTTGNPILPQAINKSSSTTNTSSTSSSTQVNNPVPASQDSDGDGIPDSWEISHGLDPNNKNDAKADPDHDGLTNLQEYQYGTDPHKRDTDGDGMPDGWEVKYGLNPLVNDADQDPDGDYLTNLGEYHFGTNPFRADRVSVNANPVCTGGSSRHLSSWDWLVFWLLLAGGAASFLTAMVLAAAPSPDSSSSKGYRFRHRLYRAFRPRGKVS